MAKWESWLARRHVGDEGAKSATIVLIGEAPGTNEEAHGRPFVGASGMRLNVWWRDVGLSRTDFYITTVVPFRPDSIDAIPREQMEAYFTDLHERLAELNGPLVIVPTGNYALYALTGKGKVPWNKMDGRVVRPGILDWRGSILSYTSDRGGYTAVVIPTLHPAFVMREPGMERRTITDWRRIAGELDACSRARGFVPTRNHRIKPTVGDVEHWVNEAIAEGKPVCFDIETPKGRVMAFQMNDGTWRTGVHKDEQGDVARYKSGKKKGELKTKWLPGRPYIGCIGVANRIDESLTIPLTLAYWKTKELLAQAKAQAQRLLASNLDKVVQNGVSFDLPWLLHDGYVINGRVWDTRCMHHALDPRDDHDLAYMASIFTRQPFWKHEAKAPEEITKYASNSEALWTYCGMDVCVTLEIFYVLKAKLQAEGLTEFYHRHYTRLVPSLLDMTMHGIAVAKDRMISETTELKAELKLLKTSLQIQSQGIPLVAKKGLSNNNLKFLLYGAKGFEGPAAEKSYANLRKKYPDVKTYDLPPIRAKNTKGTRGVTVNEVALRKLILKHPEQLAELGPMLLRYRRGCKKLEFLDIRALDNDDRMRCAYSFCTEAARLASQGTPWGKGRNLQNIDRETRYIFLADKDKEDPDGN